jgi:hypothetical protein
VTEEEREELIGDIAEAMSDLGGIVVDVPLAVHIADALIKAGYMKKPF